MPVNPLEIQQSQNAQLEMEALDPVSGERFGVLIDTAPADTSGDVSWDSIDKTLTFYAERFKARMLAAQEKAAGQTR